MEKYRQEVLISALLTARRNLKPGENLHKKFDALLHGVSAEDRGELSREVELRLKAWRESQDELEHHTSSPYLELDSYFGPTLGP